jgi:hypothetical protein
VIFENADGRQLVQVFKSAKFENWGINPMLLISCFRFPKGDVRFQLVDPQRDQPLPATDWGDQRQFPPRWEEAIPVTTLLRELAKTGDFTGTGFFRLHNRDIED